MKIIIAAVLLLAQFAVAGPASATLVDFSDMQETIDITQAINPAGYSASGVTFSYDDFGSGVDFATVDSFGIFGTTPGVLLLDFATPSTALNLNFSLLEAVLADPQTGQIPDALTVLFFRAGNMSDFTSASADFQANDPGDLTLGFATGALAYSGLSFDHAELYFSTDAPFFTVDNVSYQPVPEPTSFVLLALGLLVLGSWRYYRRRC